ncbi:N-formylglutamate amidohydrolase [Oceanicola sp. 502str15]|uniref:N-formylglutamate amidohydrolase n=1 Tax=Oceanicola sp. 502str15 TaxID=2696061 RepID=UPI002094BB1D|nr:N-formylglutamate amidohydrolase [Oceanicola sp. 502str15]
MKRGMSVAEGWEPAEVTRAEGRGPVVLVCEHASREFPQPWGDLGLGPEAAASHAAWDIGALDVAKALAALLDSPLVSARASRLIYDLNRPLEAHDAIPAKSEVYEIPGNIGLSAPERALRHKALHDPFHGRLTGVLDGRETDALVTIHSFTPVYRGVRREVELGFLYHEDARMAEAALAVERARGSYRAALNEPYAASDGVTYTLRKHGEARDLPSLMIEIRNDLIDTEARARDMAVHLMPALAAAIAAVAEDRQAAE